MSDLYQLGRRLAEIALTDMSADDLGLSPGQFLVLQDLFLNGPGPVGEIAKRTGLAQSRVSTSVRDFTQRGWATTTTDPTDGRKTLVELTPATRTAGTQRRTANADNTLHAALADVDETERTRLLDALTRLHHLLLTDHPPRRFPQPPHHT